MGAYVLLIKVSEDDRYVRYRFGPNEKIMGLIELDKLERKFKELEPVGDPAVSSQFYFDRAAQKMSICLVRNNGEFPERLTFAS